MILDSKGRLFGKISIVDILIVLIVIAAVGGVAYKFSKSRTVTPFTKPDTIQTVFYCEESPDFAVDAVKPGDIVREDIQSVSWGAVTKVDAEKSVSFATTDKGEIVATSKEDYKSAYITIEGTGIMGDNGVTFDSSQFYIGKSYVIRVGNIALYGRVYDFKKLDK